MWHVATTVEFDDWFEQLDDAARTEIIAKVTLLKQLGPRLPRPHSDTLKGSRHRNLKELRADTADQVLRVAFAFDPDRAAILLVGGNKGGMSQKLFYKQLIEKAVRLYDQHIAEIRTRKKKEEK